METTKEERFALLTGKVLITSVCMAVVLQVPLIIILGLEMKNFILACGICIIQMVILKYLSGKNGKYNKELNRIAHEQPETDAIQTSKEIKVSTNVKLYTLYTTPDFIKWFEEQRTTHFTMPLCIKSDTVHTKLVVISFTELGEKDNG